MLQHLNEQMNPANVSCITEIFITALLQCKHTWILLPRLRPSFMAALMATPVMISFSLETQPRSISLSGWLVWFGFCFSARFLARRRLRETAGLVGDPCTCSWEKPKQGYLSCAKPRLWFSAAAVAVWAVNAPFTHFKSLLKEQSKHFFNT